MERNKKEGQSYHRWTFLKKICSCGLVEEAAGEEDEEDEDEEERLTARRDILVRSETKTCL